MRVPLPSPASPFAVLVEHFIQRLFASEREQGSGSGVGVGLGAMLAFLASPGAFASIFLLDKYSVLMQYLRGSFFDPVSRSPGDEYFFIVLSMTITGMVMVTRWNRLFPDRRDFANLAILPIPISSIFLANLAALTALAFLFAMDVNCVSFVLFPLFVTMSRNSFPLLLKVGLAHAAAVLAASLFSFFAIFLLVGIMTLVIPQRIFRLASVVVRVVLVVGLLAEFYSNIFMHLLAPHGGGRGELFARWLPSYWFLGFYEEIAGIAHKQMIVLGDRALLSLGAAILLSAIVYAICYRRVFVRLPESFDTVGGTRASRRLQLPPNLVRWAFRSPFEWACGGFAWKVLTRSEQHLMFFGAYLGSGMILAAQSLTDATGGARQQVPPAELLAIPLLITFVAISGLRFAFDIPAVLDANWVFQAALGRVAPEPRSVARRMMLGSTISWQLALLLPLAVWRMGWIAGSLYAASTGAVTVFCVQLITLRFRRIPFTCKTEVEVKQLVFRLLGVFFGALVLAPGLAALQRWMLLKPARFDVLAGLLVIGWYTMLRYDRENLRGQPALEFEYAPAPQFELLKLTSM